MEISLHTCLESAKLLATHAAEIEGEVIAFAGDLTQLLASGLVVGETPLLKETLEALDQLARALNNGQLFGLNSNYS